MLEKNSKARQKKEFEEIPYKYGDAFSLEWDKRNKVVFDF